VQNFNIWVHGDKELMRGSGMFVGENGVSANHHFLTPKDGNSFAFVAGEYQIKLFAKLLDDPKEQLLWSEKLSISSEQQEALRNFGAGIYFDWGPDSKTYLSHVEKKPPRPSPEDFFGLLASTTETKPNLSN
ncbi:MAG: hypothetical protein ACX939_15385, partial [Hyphococcus sp.]